MRRTAVVITAALAFTGGCVEQSSELESPDPISAPEIYGTTNDMLRAGMQPDSEINVATGASPDEAGRRFSQTTQETVAQGMDGYSQLGSPFQRIGNYPVYAALFVGGKTSELID